LSEKHLVCSENDIPANGKYAAFVGDEEVLIVRSDGRLYAIRDCCSHQEFPLSHGAVKGKVIKCKAHGAEFDMETGKALCAPAHVPIDVFPLEVVDGKIYVELD
jgi:3-phenylpropionate/trans-cinnamate dioxygenase ferredoxin subunit